MLSADLVAALVAALLWAVIDVVRVGSLGSLVSEFPALFGSTALLLGVGIVSLRRAQPFGDGLRSVATGAAIASLPVAMVAAVLQRSTHHRALGGVTFAFLSGRGDPVCNRAAWRMLNVMRRGTRTAAVVRALLLIASIASCGAAIALMLCGVRAGGAAPLASGIVDGFISVLLGLAFRRLVR